MQLDFPCGKDALPVATDLFARFSNTAERFIMAVDPGAEESMRGRCWKMGTKLATGALSCAPDHHFRNPMLVCWETWTSNLRLCSAHLKHGKEQLVNGALGKLVEDSHHIFSNWPVATEVKSDAFEARLAEFSTSPTLPLAKWLIQISLKLTKDKLGEVRKDSDRRYRAFMEHACTARGASTGHALVKVMVKDKTIMCQQVDDKEALLSGVTIEERQASRASK